MKNWNYIEGAKTGNIKDDAKAKELHKKMMDAKEIAEEWGRASYSQKKDNLEGGRKAAEDAYRKAKKEYEDYAMNTKTGNMLLNVVAVEIGKPWMIYYDTEADEYYTDYKGTIHDNPGFRTKQEAINYVKKRMKTENKKTGNDTPWEYAHRKPKVINEDKTGAEEFFKKLAHDVDEREKKDDAEIKLVGNETYQHKLYPDKYVIIEGKNYKIITDGKVEKTGVLTDAVLYGINQTYKKVGNAQWDRAYYKQMIDPVKWNEFEKKFEKLIYDQNLERYDMEDRMSLKPELRSEKYKMIERQRKDVESMINKYRKTGNARYTTKEDVISHLDTDLYDICKKVPSGSPSFAYISELQKKGWDMNTISKYSKEIGKIIDRYKVGNKNLDWNTGTIDWDVANFNGQWYITKNGQKLKGPFPSMKEAERYLDGHKWELQDKYGNKQIKKHAKINNHRHFLCNR